MQEKIKWYQEVLELEPGSKVFFPLARLLTETGQIDEALSTLQHGIARHPEFIEARLYLIDLLYKHERTVQCDAQVAELTGLFSNYAGFWQAWGSYLTHTGKGHDLSLALSFMAASFQNADLRLVDIFAQGLQSVQALPLPRPAQPDIAAVKNVCPPPIAPESASEVSITKLVAPEPAVNMCEASASVEAANSATGFSGAEQSVGLTIPPLAELVQSLPATMAFTAQSDSLSADADAADESDDNEERFSLRTRSMAEVLAEQGDFKSAIEIYQELITQAVTPEEQLDLQHRITTLTARMGTVQAQIAESTTLPDATPGKHRLLSLLETLAVRFEAHAQG